MAATECDVPHPTAAICTSPPEMPDLMPRAIQIYHADAAFRHALDASRQSYRDPRIRAVFAIAPLAMVFSSQSLAKAITTLANQRGFRAGGGLVG